MRAACGFVIGLAIAALATGSTFAQTMGTVEDLQFKTVDFGTQVVEIHNYGLQDRPLDGMRFCTHDEMDVLKYSSAGGLNGVTLVPGESLFVHWLNDASGANAMNISDIGGTWISDLTANTTGSAVSLGFYRTGGFGNEVNLNDHVQYSFEGVDISGATPRSGPAVAAGLWSAADEWTAITADTLQISLKDIPFPADNGETHGPDSYFAVVPLSEIVAPSSVEVTVGVVASGGSTELVESDNVDFSIRRNPTAIQAVVDFNVRGPVTIAAPKTMDFTYEGSVFSRRNIVQTISMFNFETEMFEEIDTRDATRFNDATTTVFLTGDVTRFVDPVTSTVLARIRNTSDVGRSNFAVNADFVSWGIGR